MSSISSIGSNASALAGAITGSSTASSGSSGSSGASNISGTGLLNSLGLGSGLDVNAIITAMVNAAEAGPQAQITNQTNLDNNQIAGLTGLQTALTGLQTALNELTSSSTYQTYNASFSSTGSGSSATSIGTATTLPDAVPGTYSVNVSSLATAQMRTSSAYASSAAVGGGSLNISVGSNSINVPVLPTDTLQTIASNINNASKNPGVTATVVSGVNGNQLVLTSSKTGTANGFSISASSTSSSGLTSLANTLNTPGSTEATDAKLTIDGISVTSSTNTVSGALTGVTMNLSSTGTSTLTVAQSTTPITTAVNDFVSAYNNYATTVNTLTSYDPTTKQAGLLLGDPTLSAIQSQISQALSGSVAGNSVGSLAALGITRNADGTLTAGTSLASTITSNPSAVQNLFSSTKGIATQLSSLVTNYNSTTGILQTKITNLNSAITNLQTQQTALNARMATYQQQLVKQYTNLGTLMSSLNNTSSYLTALSKQSSSSS